MLIGVCCIPCVIVNVQRSVEQQEAIVDDTNKRQTRHWRQHLTDQCALDIVLSHVSVYVF